MIFTRTGRRMTRRKREHGEVSMKEIDERYIAALDEFGFGMFRTKAGVNIYLNEYTMYVVEDITGTHTDPYHYKLYFHTDILPDVEVRP